MTSDADMNAFITSDAVWTGVILIGIAGFFLAATAIGIMARLVMPEVYVSEKQALFRASEIT
jgi:hypothetical protein